MVARVGPFGDVILISPFRLTAAGWRQQASAGVGLKVIDAQTWQIVAEDRAYGDDGYGAAFAPDGRLYTVAD